MNAKRLSKGHARDDRSRPRARRADNIRSMGRTSARTTRYRYVQS
jgi:hypothetical protein